MLRHQQPGKLGEYTARMVQANGGGIYERPGRYPHHVARLKTGSKGGEARGDISAGGQLPVLSRVRLGVGMAADVDS